MKYIYLVCSLVLLLVPSVWANNTPELRGIWLTRFEWPNPDPQKCKENIVTCLDDIAKANFNTVFFQVRGEAEVLYRSDMEPWSPLIGGQDPGFDPLEFAITEAHKRGLQLHAYVNPVPMILWLEGAKAPLAKDHIFYRHGPESENSWVCIDEDGKMMVPGDAAYYYFSLGIPEVQEYLRKVIRDIVERYDIDGLHLDRIRYPGPQYSHDKRSKERFFSNGNPNHKDWQDWNREQLNKFVNDVYAETMSIKPNITISCAAWGIYSRYHIEGYNGFSSGYHDYFQDSWRWITDGSMDLLTPMIYWNMEDPKPNYQELVEDFAKGIGKNRFAGGQRMYGDNWPVEENVQQIMFSRKYQLSGTVIFSYESAKAKNAFGELRDKVYTKKVSVPDLKTPLAQNSIIVGRVINDLGEPLCDAWVTLKNFKNETIHAEKWTTGADGRFAFLNIRENQVTIEVNFHNGKRKALSVILKKGEVRTLDISVDTKVSYVPSIDIWQIHNNGDHCHVLGRTLPNNKVFIGNTSVPVFENGMFAVDNLPLKPGFNEIMVGTIDSQGNNSFRLLEIEAKKSLPDVTLPQIEIEEAWKEKRVAETIEDNAGVTHGTHDVRLGGPFISELPSGTLLELVGSKNNFYKIKLANSFYGWIEKQKVRFVEDKKSVKRTHFTYCIASGNAIYDTIFIPTSVPVPFSIESQIEPGNMLLFNLFYAHHATTWFTHKSNAKVVGEITGHQIQEDWCQLRIPIKSKQIWGYRVERNENGITIYVKRAPKVDKDNPLKNLIIAVEAGHGGSNLGAIGVSNAKEKDVNSKASAILQEELVKYGVNVIELRYRDTYPSHQERLQKALEENADLLLSLHANATATNKGFLRVSGMSTFFKHPHSAFLANCVHQQLLPLGLEEYGCVGNFNYFPLRNTMIPSVLIEQGFMTHPYDEAKLLSKEFQKQQAEAIVRALHEFLQSTVE